MQTSLAAALAAASLPLSLLAAEIDFAHQIVPVLKEHCAECHGDQEAKGSFSINTRTLFMDREMAVPGEVERSYFLELVEDSDPDYQMPPEGKPRVPPEALALLKRWVAEGLAWEPGFTFATSAYEPPLRPRRPEPPEAVDGRDHPVDRFLDRYLAEQGLPRPEPADDATFLRRAHLDLVGLLPTAEEASAFLADERADKRERLVDELLSRDLDYADHWLTFWNDLLRNDYTGTGFITGGRKQITRWLYDQLKRGAPFDLMVRELVAPPTEESSGFIDGIEWRGEVSAGQTLPLQFAQSVSQSFLGINMKCASCHDSFIDRWTLADAYGLAAIYSEEPLEIHRCDLPSGETAGAAWLFPEIGGVDPAAPKAERLSQLAALMTHPENGRVPRTLVNRLWGQLMGRGLVHPLDAMQSEPWHEDLLDFLAADFQDAGYDLRHTLRLIATSAAYQSRTEIRPEEPVGDYRYAGPVAKRLTAEQFVDAVWQLTGAGPTRIEAPVVRGLADEAEAARLASLSSAWLWGPSAEEGLAPGGDEILLRLDFALRAPLRSAGVVATADNGFTLHLNQRSVLSGSAWTQLEAAPAGLHLKEGANRILLHARNGGTSPNPAGAFLALRVVYLDGEEEIFATGDEGWQVSERVPSNPNPARWDLEALDWIPAMELPAATWAGRVDPQIGPLLAEVSAGAPLMVRAGLVESDFLMRSLGRPNRDQIVSSRPSELTALEAIDLANQQDLASWLRQGAGALAEESWGSPGALVEHLFLSTLSRPPTEGEREILLELVGDLSESEVLADVLWALLSLPEFLTLR